MSDIITINVVEEPVDVLSNLTLQNNAISVVVAPVEQIIAVNTDISTPNISVDSSVVNTPITVNITQSLDAYQIAVQQGFSGTREQWIASLTSDLSYTHTQSIAATIWTVNHNLGKRPAVHVEDSSGAEHVGDVVHQSPSSLTLSFANAFGGIAVCN